MNRRFASADFRMYSDLGGHDGPDDNDDNDDDENDENGENDDDIERKDKNATHLDSHVIEFDRVKELESERERNSRELTHPSELARRYTMSALRFSKRIEKKTTTSRPARLAKKVVKGVHHFFDSHTLILG